MTKENSQNPKTYQEGEQIWFIDRSHCPYRGECPVSHPCVKTGRIVSVLMDGQYYTLSDREVISAKNVYSTPEAARADIPEVVNAKITVLQRRIAELEGDRDKVGTKWCPLLDTAACYQDCGWYDNAKAQCAIISIAKLAPE